MEKNNKGRSKSGQKGYERLAEESKALNAGDDSDEAIQEDEVEFELVEDEGAARTTFLPMTNNPQRAAKKTKLGLGGLNQSMENPYLAGVGPPSARESDETPRSAKSGGEDSLGGRISGKTGWMVSSITIAKSFFGIGSLAIPWGFHLCGF